MNKYDQALNLARREDQIVHHDKYIVLPATESTVDYAADAIKQGARHGDNIIAYRLSKGKSPIDPHTGESRKWESPPGNLHLGRVVDIRRDKGEHEWHMEWIAALAAGEVAVRAAPADPKLVLHLPNDLWHQRDNGGFAQLAGFVMPMDVNAQTPQGVLGVSVHIAVAPPAETLRAGTLATSAISMRDLKSTITVGEFLEQFETRFEAHLADFRANGFVPILEKMGLSKPGSNGEMTMRLRGAQNEVTGTFVGFSTTPPKTPGENQKPIGNLRLKVQDGKVLRYPSRSLNLLAPVPKPS